MLELAKKYGTTESVFFEFLLELDYSRYKEEDLDIPIHTLEEYLHIKGKDLENFLDKLVSKCLLNYKFTKYNRERYITIDSYLNHTINTECEVCNG